MGASFWLRIIRPEGCGFQPNRADNPSEARLDPAEAEADPAEARLDPAEVRVHALEVGS
ncbi:MAG: hypothetical protein ABF683_03275 [Sporolactobacillus sp.]